MCWGRKEVAPTLAPTLPHQYPHQNQSTLRRLNRSQCCQRFSSYFFSWSLSFSIFSKDCSLSYLSVSVGLSYSVPVLIYHCSRAAGVDACNVLSRHKTRAVCDACALLWLCSCVEPLKRQLPLLALTYCWLRKFGDPLHFNEIRTGGSFLQKLKTDGTCRQCMTFDYAVRPTLMSNALKTTFQYIVVRQIPSLIHFMVVLIVCIAIYMS